MFNRLWALVFPAPAFVARGNLLITVHLKRKTDATKLAEELSQLHAEFALAVQRWCLKFDNNRTWKFELTPGCCVDTAGPDQLMRIAGYCSEEKSPEAVASEFASLCDSVIPELGHVVYGPQIICELQLSDGTVVSPSLRVSAAAAYAAFA